MDSQELFSITNNNKSSISDTAKLEQNSEQNSNSVSKNIQPANISELYKSRDNLREFASKIGSICNLPIRRDVRQHCNKIKMNWNLNLGFDKIDKMVKNRIQKMIKNKRIKKNWSEEDIIIFIWVVSKFADYKGTLNIQRDLNQKDWDAIADIIPGVQAEVCMFKWLGLRKLNLSQNCWSQRQSGILQKIVKKFGEDDWSLIAQKLYYANNSVHKVYRCPKQCRQHWNCYLNPKLKKGPWQKQQDILLLSSVLKNNGQKRWAQIVKEFNGRTENALKNRYTLIIDKELKNTPGNMDRNQLQIIKQYLQRIYIDQFMAIDNDNDSITQTRMKDIKSALNKTQETPKKQVRTSLRRKISTQSNLVKKEEQCSPISYCDIVLPKIEASYTPRTSRRNTRKNNNDNQQQTILKKNTSKTQQNKTQKLNLKRWNSTPNIQDPSQQQSQQQKCYKPISYHYIPIPQHQQYNQINPIYEEQNDLNLPYQRNYNHYNQYDHQPMIFHGYNNKGPLFSPLKNSSPELYPNNNIFSSFNDHDQNIDNNQISSPLSFHSFQQFVMNYQCSLDSHNHIDLLQDNSQHKNNPERQNSKNEHDDIGTGILDDRNY